MTLYYSLASHPMLNIRDRTNSSWGFPYTCHRDGSVYAFDSSSSIYHSSKDVYVHVSLQSFSLDHTNVSSSESPIIAKLQYGMKITFIFILILFIDSVNRVYRVQLELAESIKKQG